LDFRVLGPLRASCDGRVLPIGTAYKPRLVLAALLVRADQAVRLDRLIEVVWGEHPPASARRNTQQYIHRLRTVLGGDRIESRPDGYLIRAGNGLDAARFRHLAAQGGTALRGGAVLLARDRSRAALDLWHGPAYAEFTDCPEVADEAARLDELRLTVCEQWAEAELTLGRHGAPAQELSELVRAHPYRESLRGLLMRSLYGTGRQTDALQLYRDTRALLAEQLGIEPGPQLQRLHERMLRGHGRFARPGVDALATPAPRELPAGVAGFTGRRHALKALDELLPTGGPIVIATVVGAAGVGKTALAVHWAHRVADRFPDGQLYLDLRGYATGAPVPPDTALAAFLRSLGMPPRDIPVDVVEAARRYRSVTATRRMLIVLDNAASAEQVRPLVPGSPGCLVLVTSRDRLDGLVARDGARRVALDRLTPAEATDLLGRLLGAGRIAAEPAATDELARTCAYLPLALRLAAAALLARPGRAVAEYAAELTVGDLSDQTSPPAARDLLRQLGSSPVRTSHPAWPRRWPTGRHRMRPGPWNSSPPRI
jgi:DNA-binding SARP family transcriptional activator